MTDTPKLDARGQRSELLEACRIVESYGFIVVRRDSNNRLRRWLNLTGGWPPADWEPIVFSAPRLPEEAPRD